MDEKGKVFFENKGLSVEKMLAAKKGRFAAEQIQAGMEKVFNRIAGGEDIKDIRLAWEVWKEAGNILAVSSERAQKGSINTNLLEAMLLELQRIQENTNGQNNIQSTVTIEPIKDFNVPLIAIGVLSFHAAIFIMLLGVVLGGA